MSIMAQFFLKWDSRMLKIVTGRMRKSAITRIMQWISRSADGQIYPAVVAIFTVLQADRRKAFVACALGFAIELAVYKLIKQAVKRPRPFQALAGVANLIAPPDAFSFPSGHTAGAFVLTTIIGFSYPLALLPLGLWAAVVGLSRIYLCVHYPTDVFAGAWLGILSAKAGLFLADQGVLFSLF